MQTEILEKKTIHSILPVANIFETPKSYIVSLDIPGAVKESIKANIENNTLVISASVTIDIQSENSEASKQFYREFSLANDIDIDTVAAHYELGVLRVTLNKKQQYLSRQITIK
ncbi:MAG: Hsp20/alpha crystallin family protein [Bacteroidota bacterium]|nr:Hsp20/alpha crystallin family protein [Bacteroidota bacterium]